MRPVASACANGSTPSASAVLPNSENVVAAPKIAVPTVALTSSRGKDVSTTTPPVDRPRPATTK
jgi:hypothetical protein